jgi:hypothetical protein
MVTISIYPEGEGRAIAVDPASWMSTSLPGCLAGPVDVGLDAGGFQTIVKVSGDLGDLFQPR